MATILHLLQKYSAEERVLATIIRLIKIFKYNYHEPDGFFQDFVGSEITRSTRNECTKVDYSNLEIVENLNCEANLITPQSDSNFEIVTFEFDNGSCVSANKTLICKNSPVLDSMLNGHFVEAGQERVRLQKCTDKSFLHLVSFLISILSLVPFCF